MSFAPRASRLPRTSIVASRLRFPTANQHTTCASARPLSRPSRRGVVTASHPPTASIERPEALILAESALYRHSWEGAAADFFPSTAGLHFANVDITGGRSVGQRDGAGDGAGNIANDMPSLKLLEQTLAEDLSNLGEMADVGGADAFLPGHHAPQTTASAHSVLIARGPLQCLVAQYFLESLPLAGLVLVDPLLLPEDGRDGKKTTMAEGESRWRASVMDCLAMLDGAAPHLASAAYEESSHPLMLTKDNTDIERGQSSAELSILQSLAHDEATESARPLRLEPGSMPLLVLYTGDHIYHDHYRICAERTAAFHTCGGGGDFYDQVSVLKTKTKVEAGGPVEDLEWAMRSIYGWYDEVVA
ncbi:hypothetical protein ACHAXT_008451 [Thalassiosira profunda]